MNDVVTSSSTHPLTKSLIRWLKRRKTMNKPKPRSNSLTQGSSPSPPTDNSAPHQVADSPDSLDHHVANNPDNADHGQEEHIYQEITITAPPPRLSRSDSLFNTRFNKFHRLMYQRSSVDEPTSPTSPFGGFFSQIGSVKSREVGVQCDEQFFQNPASDCHTSSSGSSSRKHGDRNTQPSYDDSVDKHVAVSSDDQTQLTVGNKCNAHEQVESDYVEYNPPASVESGRQQSSPNVDDSTTTVDSVTTDSGCGWSTSNDRQIISTPAFQTNDLETNGKLHMCEADGRRRRQHAETEQHRRRIRAHRRHHRHTMMRFDQRRSPCCPTTQWPRSNASQQNIYAEMDSVADQSRQRVVQWLDDVTSERDTRDRRRRQRRNQRTLKYVKEHIQFEIVL